MDILSAASKLRQQLISLQHSDAIISVLEREVTRLNEHCLMTSINDIQSRRLLLRISITDGVHQMYQQYSSKKWAQVQNTARFIKSQLESDNDDTTTTTTTSVRQQPDRTTDQWSSLFCELCRHD